MEGVESDKNDQALMQYFLRGMVRFRKYVEGVTFDEVNRRIDAAYLDAAAQFAKKEKQ
jgi:hypothetical protein